MMIGITAATTREQMVRAALESMAYQTRDLLEEMERKLRHQTEKIRKCKDAGFRGVMTSSRELWSMKV